MTPQPASAGSATGNRFFGRQALVPVPGQKAKGKRVAGETVGNGILRLMIRAGFAFGEVFGRSDLLRDFEQEM